MAFLGSCILCLIPLSLLSGLCFSEETEYTLELSFSYNNRSLLGVPKQVIAVNGTLPGPTLNVTTGAVVKVNVTNKLDEDLLITWPGLRMRREFWQDGVLGTNCPIPPNQTWRYQFQVKDQIGSFFYFPSLNFQRSAGGFGSFIISNISIVTLPYDIPDDDIIVFIGDWYTQNHTALRKTLDDGKDLGIPDGVLILINGTGPHMNNGIDNETINVHPGKTYRVRVHNVGVSTCLNFRIQNHSLLLIETEGHYTFQQWYPSFDIHVGQSYTFLVKTNQTACDYYIIATPILFVNASQYNQSAVAILHYWNSKGNATCLLPIDPLPSSTFFSMEQAMSISQLKYVRGASLSRQDSFLYGNATMNYTFILRSSRPQTINGSLRATFNGISFKNPDYPIMLADKFEKSETAYDLDFPNATQQTGPPRIATSLINGKYRYFMELILQNNDSVVQSFHMDGHSFFVIGMGIGTWTENSRRNYTRDETNAITRSTVQVFQGGWTAVIVYLDNVGVWNLRAENLDRWYLGQETYIKVVDPDPNPKKNKEAVFNKVPNNVIYCGAIKDFEPSKAIAMEVEHSKLYLALLMVFSASISILC